MPSEQPPTSRTRSPVHPFTRSLHHPPSCDELYTPENAHGTSKSHTVARSPQPQPSVPWRVFAKSLCINVLLCRGTLAPELPLGMPQAPDGWATDPGGSANGGPKSSKHPHHPSLLDDRSTRPPRRPDAVRPPIRARSLPAPGPPLFVRRATCARGGGYQGHTKDRGSRDQVRRWRAP